MIDVEQHPVQERHHIVSEDVAAPLVEQFAGGAARDVRDQLCPAGAATFSNMRLERNDERLFPAGDWLEFRTKVNDAIEQLVSSQ